MHWCTALCPVYQYSSYNLFVVLYFGILLMVTPILSYFSFFYASVLSYTPTIQSFIAAVFIVASDINFLIDAFSSVAWVFYGLSFVSLLIMRVTHRKTPRPYKVVFVCIGISMKCVWIVHTCRIFRVRTREFGRPLAL